MTAVSADAKHKLFSAGLLLLLFSIPFFVQRENVTVAGSKAVLAGGAVIGGSAAPIESQAQPLPNESAKATYATGHSFTGDLTR